MKKLVTIVSAVMMLLMLAACAPSVNYNAEQMEEIQNGETAVEAIKQAAQDAFNDVYDKAATDENMKIGSTYEYTAEEDTEVTVEGAKYTVAKGSKAVMTISTDSFGNADNKTLKGAESVEGSVSWKVNADDAEATSFSVVAYYGEGSIGFAVNGHDYSDYFASTLL